MASVHGLRLGWHRDLPDIRDNTEDTEAVSNILVKSNRVKAVKKKLPKKIDLREWCSPVEDQGELGSCTAHAGVACWNTTKDAPAENIWMLRVYSSIKSHGNYWDSKAMMAPTCVQQ